jgi:hypothetical protein
LKKGELPLKLLSDLSENDYVKLIADFVEPRDLFPSSYSLLESGRVSDALRHICECRLDEPKYNFQASACEAYNLEAAQFEECLRGYDAGSARQEGKLVERRMQQREQLWAMYESDLAALADVWPSAAKRRKYNHLSGQLM